MDNLCLAQETSLNVYTNYENYQGSSSYADEAIKSEVNHFVRHFFAQFIPSPKGEWIGHNDKIE